MSSLHKHIESIAHFPSILYLVEANEFLSVATQEADKAISTRKSEVPADFLEHTPYPVYHTGSLLEQPALSTFITFIAQSGWNILDSQGYDMNNFSTSIIELWAQEHHKYSLMEQHVHGSGAQLTGMYILEVPDDTTRVIVHDPRPGKVIIDLPEKDVNSITPASSKINVLLKPGMMIFANSWLPHSFGKNMSNKPFKFIHFNIGVNYEPQQHACSLPAAAEVI